MQMILPTWHINFISQFWQTSNAAHVIIWLKNLQVDKCNNDCVSSDR